MLKLFLSPDSDTWHARPSNPIHLQSPYDIPSINFTQKPLLLQKQAAIPKIQAVSSSPNQAHRHLLPRARERPLTFAMDGGGGAKKSRNPHKAPADYRSDRKSASGMSGEPKKGGRGGKFTWEGADGYADEDLDLISPKNSTSHSKSAASAAAADSSSNKKSGDDE